MTARTKIIGMMSGTSGDGVDAALVEFDDQGVVARLETYFEAYSEEERQAILANMGRWHVSRDALDAVHAAHNRALESMPEADYIGFHGQTFNHDPASRRTYQAGDPEQLQTEADVIFDFRTKDVKAGGEGAPLMPIYHYALVRELGLEEPVEIVNIGGVANVSYIDPSLPPEEGILAFDTGVGNAMSDDLMQHFFHRSFDINGEKARLGRPDKTWLKSALSHDFFDRQPPKSLDRLSLYQSFDALRAMEPEDAIATAIEFCIQGIEGARQHYPKTPTQRILAGGGRRNSFLTEKLGAVNIDDFGFNGDMIEAEGFAYLAWAFLQNRPISFPMTTGTPEPLVAGRLHSRKARPNTAKTA